LVGTLRFNLLKLLLWFLKSLKENLRFKIINQIIKELTSEKRHFLDLSREYLDAARVFYYHEQWNLCLLQSVISMESALASLVFNSDVTKYYVKRVGSLTKLKEKYRKAQGLPKKVEKFLFPVAEWLSLNKISLEISKIMPIIYNKKSKEGIYDLRSKVVHEGISITKEQAEQAVKVASRFLQILNLINENAR